MWPAGKRQAQGFKRFAEIEMVPVSRRHHFGGADELEAWEAHSVVTGHRQDCPPIEARPEGYDGVDIPQNLKHPLPSL